MGILGKSKMAAKNPKWQARLLEEEEEAGAGTESFSKHSWNIKGILLI